MRKNKKLILISSILATTAMVAVPAISIVNNINTVNVSQLDNVVQNSQQVESTATLIINSNECNVGSSKATEWMGITAGTGFVNFEIDDVGLTATVKNMPKTTITSTYLKIPGSITYNGNTYTVTSIGNYAFIDCSNLNGTLTIPASVTSIGAYAFSYCSGLIGTLTIPASVTSIGANAFEYCSGLDALDLSSATGLTDIGGATFQHCSGLTGTLTIPASVTTVYIGAFGFCSGLTSVSIPDSVTTIEMGAFSYCSGLTSVIIGSGVNSIGANAFQECKSIKEITILATTPPAIEANSFDNYAATVFVPIGCEGAYKNDTNWGKFNIEPIPTPTGSITLSGFQGSDKIIAGAGGNIAITATIDGTLTPGSVKWEIDNDPDASTDKSDGITLTDKTDSGCKVNVDTTVAASTYHVILLLTGTVNGASITSVPLKLTITVDPVEPTDNLNLPLIIGASVGGAVVVLGAIAGTVTYVIKRNKKDKKIKSN